MEENDLKHDGCRYLAAMLVENVFITNLNLKNNDISGRGVQYLANASAVSIVFNRL